MNEKKNWALNLTACVLLMAALPPMAGAQVTVPNVFENGKVADADEVNENFNALADGINGASCSVGPCTASNQATLSCGDTSVQIPCVQPPKTVFVTSETYTGDLGGLAGADEKCNALASDAGLTGTYMAWLSDTSASPATRFTKSSTVPYVLVGGTVIANNWDDLITGGLRTQFPQWSTESGYFLTPFDSDGGSSYEVWTSTLTDGTFNESDNPYFCSSSCNDWTLSSSATAPCSVGLWFLNSLEDYYWTESPIPQGFCNKTRRLYCFEQ